jgi:hypothetical protein
MASQCPNKNAIILQDHREVKTESNNSDDETLLIEDVSDGDVEYSVEGEFLVIRCALNVQIKKDLEHQRENIFHTRFHIRNKICSIVIDVGSYANIAGTILLKKLNLNTTKH